MMVIKYIFFTALVTLLSAPVFAQDKHSIKPWLPPGSRAELLQPLPQGTLSSDKLQSLITVGESLFARKFNLEEGAGRPGATAAIIPTHTRRKPQQMFSRVSGMDANSCASCHNDPIIGGAGDFTTNVFVSEGFTNVDFDSTDPEYSNERNTNHLMGAGLVELLAREMTRDLQNIRSSALSNARRNNQQVTVELITKGVSFGKLIALQNGALNLSKIAGVDPDLVVRPFSQKGVITSLRQFTINALNQHHGMQAQERFGPRWTGEEDFDGDAINAEISPYQVSALVAWQATLAPPVIRTPGNTKWREYAKTGDKLYDEIDCSQCHQKSLPLDSLSFTDPGPLDAAGTLRIGEFAANAIYDLALQSWAKNLSKNAQGQYMIPLFGDLKRHVMSDAEITTLGNELLSQRFVERSEFMTSELWGIASTAPYGHRGDILSLDEMILAHGGEARKSRDQYEALPQDSKDAIIAYLQTLEIAK